MSFFEKASGSGSTEWVMEKVFTLLLIPTSLYVIFSMICVYDSYGSLDSFFVNVTNVSALILFLFSSLSLAFLRGIAIFDDYLSSKKVRLFSIIVLAAVNMFLFLVTFISLIYYHLISLMLTF